MGKELSTIAVVKTAIEKRRESIWLQKAGYLQTEKQAWFEKALLYISGEDYLMKTLSTGQGQAALIRCLFDACSLGLEFGGPYPQAYIVPFKGEPTLIPTAAGMKAIAMSSPAVIQDITYALVRKNEYCSIDIGAGTVQHSFDPIKYGGEQGEIVGAYAVVEKLSGSTVVTYMSKKQIEAIRDSTPAYKKGGVSDAWEKFFPDMALKTVVKKALKPFMGMKNKAAVVDYEEGPREYDCEEKKPPKDISDRVGERLASQKPVEKPVTTPDGGKPVEKKEELKEGDLF